MPYRILVIEDDPIMQMILRDTIRAEGYECLLCPNAASAPAAAGQRPDLILLDIHLPDGNGKDVCRALKADAATRHIPVIMLTGEARSVEERVAGLEVGAEDYLLKPVSPKVLAARIKAILKVATKPT